MNVGKLIRLNRIFSHPSGRLCSIAVDHFMGYPTGMHPSLYAIQPTLAQIVKGKPDAVTMHKGMAASAWLPYAGQIPLIVQTTLMRPDDEAMETIVTPEDAIRLGADAIAIAGYVRGKAEAAYLRSFSDCVREAARFELPVICHIYPRRYQDGTVEISYAPEDIAWAAHCAAEVGVDVIKTPYCGDLAAHTQIVANSPVPVVAAGGPKTKTLEAALDMMGAVVKSGARGATIGRNVWGIPQITAAVQAFKSVIHDGLSAQEALKLAGL
jgi:fructose-bisphosphate aldolase, class I